MQFFSIHQGILKKMGFHKNFKQLCLTFIKKIIEQNINILEWFLKDHVTGVMMLKIQLWISSQK